jgi:hypothetical protein
MTPLSYAVSHPETTASSSLSSSSRPHDEHLQDVQSPVPKQTQRQQPADRDVLVVSSSLEIPLETHIAFDAFSDLPRQPSWSPWLHSVEYIHKNHHNEPNNNNHTAAASSSSSSVVSPPETKWTVCFRGFRFSWDAIHTRLQRPTLIEWESTSGLKNYGQVRFDPIVTRKNDHRHHHHTYHGSIHHDLDESKNQTFTAPTITAAAADSSGSISASSNMTLTITFCPPSWLAFLMKRSQQATKFVEERMLRTTLYNFCQVLLLEQEQLQQPQLTLELDRNTKKNKVEGA